MTHRLKSSLTSNLSSFYDMDLWICETSGRDYACFRPPEGGHLSSSDPEQDNPLVFLSSGKRSGGCLHQDRQQIGLNQGSARFHF